MLLPRITLIPMRRKAGFCPRASGFAAQPQPAPCGTGACPIDISFLFFQYLYYFFAPNGVVYCLRRCYNKNAAEWAPARFRLLRAAVLFRIK